MKLYYYKAPGGNFGDDLNEWIWDELLPGVLDDDEEVRFSGIGTIIRSGMPTAKRWIVFSSGVGYGSPPEGFGGPGWDIICVRGKLSAQALSLDVSKAVTDGALLLNLLPAFRPLPETERKGVVFVAHISSLETGKWPQACSLANIEYVNPEQDGKAVIGRIRSAKLVIADSMHGAIIADAMRVPWIPVVTSPRINTFKWMDWTSSVGLPYAPYLLGHSSVYDLLRNSSLGLYGDRVFHPNGTPDQVLERFKRQGRIRNLAWWPWYSDAARMLLYRIPKRLLSVAVPALCDKLSRGAVESAAANLEEAKRSTSYLSEPRVFDSRIQQLLAGLEQVKRLGGGVARGLAVLASDFSMGASASVEEIVVAILRSTIC